MPKPQYCCGFVGTAGFEPVPIDRDTPSTDGLERYWIGEYLAIKSFMKNELFIDLM
jgi:hypothetical protein